MIARIAPNVRIVDVTHGIRGIRAGAFVLRRSLPFAPTGVHLSIVDPGVGTERKGVVIVAGNGSLLVGPDNGLLTPAAEALGGATAAFELSAAEYRLEPVSATFHGRDVFAPAAAHLATGVYPSQLGPALDVDSLVRLPEPYVAVREGQLESDVLQTDWFGNILLAASAADLAAIEPGGSVRISCEVGTFDAVVARTFADADPGELVVYEDSFGHVAIARNGGDARERLQDPSRLTLSRNR